MKIPVLILGLIFSVTLQAQQVVTAIKGNENKPTHQNIIKFGSSISAEVYNSYYYDYGYFYQEADDYEGGYNIPVFVSFEHIWEMQNQGAFSIEPMVGASVRENLTSFYMGSEFKYYWANNGWWRMGVSFNAAYSYGTTQTFRWVSMDNGNYHELRDLTVHYNIVSIDPGIIPFQFHIKNSPLVIESMISMFGMNLITRTTDKFQVDEDTYQRISSFDPRPYLFKFELKVGFVLP